MINREKELEAFEAWWDEDVSVNSKIAVYGREAWLARAELEQKLLERLRECESVLSLYSDPLTLVTLLQKQFGLNLPCSSKYAREYFTKYKESEG